MADNRVKDALLKELDEMSVELQQKVLSFATSLNRPLPNGTPIAKLLRFAGTISREDGETMMKVIDEGCEQVDVNGW
jgi:hypothetical protein